MKPVGRPCSDRVGVDVDLRSRSCRGDWGRQLRTRLATQGGAVGVLIISDLGIELEPNLTFGMTIVLALALALAISSSDGGGDSPGGFLRSNDHNRHLPRRPVREGP